jgi:hypothetical protein
MLTLKHKAAFGDDTVKIKAMLMKESLNFEIIWNHLISDSALNQYKTPC